MVFLLAEKQLKCLLLAQSYLIYRKRIKFYFYLRVSSLTKPHLSQWAKQKQMGDDLAYWATVGLSVSAFNYLFEKFRSHKYFTKPVHRGIGAYDMLGLVLQYLRNTGYQRQLQQTFGYSAARVSRSLNTGMDLLLDILQEEHYSRIRWPDIAKMEEFSQVLEVAEPALGCKIIGFLDGFRLNIYDFTERNLQNAYWNGKYHSNIANLVCFTADGCICWYAINMPGSWGDGRLAQKFYQRICDPNKLPEPYMLLADQGFAAIKNKLIITNSDSLTASQKAAATSIRQAVEWGIGSIKKSWARLGMPLRCDTEYNRRLILISLYMHNFKTRFTGVNQIRTVFYGGLD